MKNFQKYTFLAFALLAFNFAAYCQNDWKPIEEQEGVRFSYINKVSKVNGSVNTIVKVDNTTEGKVEVTFTPLTSCDGETFTEQPEASVVLAGGDHSLYTYKLCAKGQTPSVKLNDVSLN